MKRLLVLFVLVPLGAFGQLSKQDSLWLPLAPFIGSWQGKGGGEPGIGDYQRFYTRILNKRFIEYKNKSVYPPTEKNHKGEVHEDVGFISYDRIRQKFVLRQFHVEGFVNQFTLDSLSADGKTIVFVSEAIENIAAGWRAKESYYIHSGDEITETFELAEPGKPFKVYSKVTLYRVK